MTKTGFTLTELLVTITIFVLVLGGVYSSYVLSQRAFLEGERAAELTQNGRVFLERLTREVRQAREITGELPETKQTATSTIEFEDGNRQERYHYIRYFQADGETKREVKRYYFPEDPNTFVVWDAGENLEFVITEEPQTVGEFAQDLKFWSPEIAVVDVFLVLKKADKEISFSTRIFGRNL